MLLCSPVAFVDLIVTRRPCVRYTDLLNADCSMSNELDDLFARLFVASAPAEIGALQDGIWQLWLNTGDAALDKELETGMRHLQAGNYGPAIDCFSRIIQFFPAYAEAWNKRATAHYLRGEYRASLDDITETLRREPRHFGALWGQAGIFEQLGEVRRALTTLRKLSAICATLPGLPERQRHLRELLDGEN